MNVIIVTINYRLGVLGFMALDRLESGEVSNANFGLQDQVAAIKWVADNIEEFGGDKERITVHGQSAGATSTSLHLLNMDVMRAIKVLFLFDELNKTFQSVIIQSSPFSLPAKSKEEAQSQFQLVAEYTGCTSENGVSIDCLRFYLNRNILYLL